MAPPEPTLGILGPSPRGVLGPLRAGRFADVERLLGRLEEASYLAGHAACHALMNGVRRVVVAGVADPADPEAWAETLERLLLGAEVSAIVAPGCPGPEALCRLVAGVLAHGERAPETPPLWLDAPAGAGAEAVVALAASLGAGPPAVRLALPDVVTLTPGRRAAEALPATCLVAPLALGTAASLRGVHDAPAAPDPDALAALQAAGALVLVGRGPRRLVTLAYAPPPAGAAPSPDGTLEGRLALRVQAAVDRAAYAGANGPALWRRVGRDVTAALRPLLADGTLAALHVRCDAETNAEGAPDDPPVVEVVYRLPHRVREVVLRARRA